MVPDWLGLGGVEMACIRLVSW